MDDHLAYIDSLVGVVSLAQRHAFLVPLYLEPRLRDVYAPEHQEATQPLPCIEFLNELAVSATAEDDFLVQELLSLLLDLALESAEGVDLPIGSRRQASRACAGSSSRTR